MWTNIFLLIKMSINVYINKSFFSFCYSRVWVSLIKIYITRKGKIFGKKYRKLALPVFVNELVQKQVWLSKPKPFEQTQPNFVYIISGPQNIKNSKTNLTRFSKYLKNGWKYFDKKNWVKSWRLGLQKSSNEWKSKKLYFSRY